MGRHRPYGASDGQAPALPVNIRLGWKGLPETNTLAYYENPLITAAKSFIVQAPEVQTCDKHFSSLWHFAVRVNDALLIVVPPYPDSDQV
jgi:hypothetical protein